MICRMSTQDQKVHPQEPPTADDELLLSADSLLSLIRHREATGLSQQTIRDVDALLARLRPRTNAIYRAH